MRYAILCNNEGETMCGSDGYLRLDARNNKYTQMKDVIKYRNSFKKNFPHKYTYWTHVMFSNGITEVSIPIKIKED